MMNSSETEIQHDVWSEWLLRRRHGNDAEYATAIRPAIQRYAKRVLEGACLRQGMTLADIGAGEGLIAFNAIEQIGTSLTAILTDVSLPMLQHTEAIARARNLLNQCKFLHCPAENLTGIDNDSVDVVTTRSVLAYVHDKKAALREFYRILKPGGRISLAEPIMRDDAQVVMATRKAVDDLLPGSTNQFIRLFHRWKATQFPDTQEKIASNSLTNYNERDLVNFVHENKFSEIHLELHIDILPNNITSWQVFLESSPHPLAPPLIKVLNEQFSTDERTLFESVMRPVIEGGQVPMVDRVAYLTATKPLI